MAQSTLLTHCGARRVSRHELETIDAPPPTDTWFPLKHATVVDTVGSSLACAGFTVQRAQYALSRSNARLFATLDLETPVATGVTLCVGIRNSTDKSLPLGFCAGSKVFVCDNLCFRSELLVTRKHTRFGQERFQEAICQAVTSLTQFQDSERERIKRFQLLDVTDTQAESMMLRAYERGIVSLRLLPRLIKEWRAPSFEEFSEKTYWSLENCFTTVLSTLVRSNPQRFCSLTLSLQGLLAESTAPATPALSLAV